MFENAFIESRLRVIVADDNDIVREIIRAIVETGVSADCSSANCLEHALQIASDHPTDLALLDYNMPGMDGLDGLRRILSTDVRHVALLSGGISSDVIDEAMDMGISGYLPKALPPREMIKAVTAMCQGEQFAADHFLGRLPIH